MLQTTYTQMVELLSIHFSTSSTEHIEYDVWWSESFLWTANIHMNLFFPP